MTNMKTKMNFDANYKVLRYKLNTVCVNRCVNQCVDWMRKSGAWREAVAVHKSGGRWIDIPRRNIFLVVSVGAH